MPNIRDWIERQRKKGYSINRIKNFLIRKGYSPEIIAQVDKFDIAKSAQQKTKNRKISLKYIFITLAVIIILIFVFNYFSNNSIIEPKEDISNGQNYTIHRGNYVGNENGIIILENGGKELRVIHETPKYYFQIYKRQKNGDYVLIDKKEPELGTPLILYIVNEDNKQKIKKIVIDNREELT